jgi:hypothetical protein
MEFFGLSYWERAWILQEFSLGRETSIWCGRDSIPLSSVLVVITWREGITGRARPQFAGLVPWRSVQSGRLLNRAYLENIRTINQGLANDQAVQGGAPRRSRFVIAVKNLVATDPRDKVYSVLGMANIAVKPDYSACVETVFAQFAKFLCLSSGDLGFLDLSALGILPVGPKDCYLRALKCIIYSYRHGFLTGAPSGLLDHSGYWRALIGERMPELDWNHRASLPAYATCSRR